MGIKSVGEIVNDESMKRLTKSKSNDKSMTGNKKYKIAYTEHVADELVKVFDAPNSRKFFLKCAWHLSEDTIWSAVDDSKKRGVNSPIKLFVFLCSNALRKLPIKR